MAKITHDVFDRIEIPSLLLQNKTFETIGKIANTSSLTYKDNMNAANELSFTVPYKINGEVNPLWDKIVDRKVIYIPEYKERFSITVSLNEDTDGIKKTVTGSGLCEYELSCVKLYNIEINTENDMAREDYDKNFPSIFYRDLDITLYDWEDSKYNGKYDNYTDEQKLSVLKNGSVLHRILEKASNYSIGHIDDTLKTLGRIYTFSIDDKDIYSTLTDDLANAYGIKFEFDSETRTVSAYDLYNTCDKCGYRGDFNTKCPECESVEFHGQYGKDTTVFVSRDNLANSLTRESDEASYFNTFYVLGGDDNMNAAVANANPTGSNYVYYFSPETLEDMPDDLSSKIDEYNYMYDDYIKNTKYYIDNSDEVNKTIQYIKKYYPDTEFKEFIIPLNNFEELSSANYSLIDLDLYLRNGMMPTPIINNESLEQTIKKLNNKAITSVSTNTISMDVLNKAVIGAVKIQINTSLYEPEIVKGAIFDSVKHAWVGKIKLTTIADKDKVDTTNTLTIPINNNVEEYIKNQIVLKMKKSDLVDAIKITNVDVSESEFKERCRYYCLTSLEDLEKELSVCQNVIVENRSNIEAQSKDLYTTLYNKYTTKINDVIDEEDFRNGQINSVTVFHENIKEEINNVRKTLNFQTFLGDEWNNFCIYRKESQYKNDNYISDDLSNGTLLNKANDLLKIAKRELYKASTPQYSISSSVNNLLAIPEFKPLWDSFEVGNWINVEVCNVVYKLRLLSYQIDFSEDNIQNIQVEFSTVTNIANGYSDIQSVLQSAKSMSNSYSGLTQQMVKTTDTVKQVDSWVNNGFDATANQIVNSLQDQNIIIDRSGILCRSFEDIMDEYDPCQLKIISNGLYCTDDNWETVKAAIGKYAYTDSLTGEMKISFGILAENIVGKQIISEKNIITNDKGTVVIDGDGITLDGGTIKWIKSPPVNSTKFRYCISDSDTELLNETEWSEIFPVKIEGKYIWQECVVTYADSKKEVTISCVSGNDGQDAISLVVTSSDGTVFKNNTGTTTLTAHVFIGGVEQYIDDDGVCKYGTINWYKRNENTSFATTKSIIVTADMVNGTESYIAKLEGDGIDPDFWINGTGDSSAAYTSKAINTDFETSIFIEQKEVNNAIK